MDINGPALWIHAIYARELVHEKWGTLLSLTSSKHMARIY